MKNNKITLPQEQEILQQMGENIRMARLRRNFSVQLICDRAGVSRTTLWQIEKGNPSVSIGNYIMVCMSIGGFDKDFLKICEDDKLGKTLVELGISNKWRINKKKES